MRHETPAPAPVDGADASCGTLLSRILRVPPGEARPRPTPSSLLEGLRYVARRLLLQHVHEAMA